MRTYWGFTQRFVLLPRAGLNYMNKSDFHRSAASPSQLWSDFIS